jgi:hypothetical protein
LHPRRFASGYYVQCKKATDSRTVETSALSGKNVAQLIFNGWYEKRKESSDGKGLKTETNWDFKPLDNAQRPIKADL